MKKHLILLAVSAFLLTGCEKILDKEGYAKKMGAAEEAAAAAQAKVAAMTAAKALGTSSSAEDRKAAGAMALILCSSPNLVEELEGDASMLEALSGEGIDKNEAARQFLEFQKKYRAAMQRALPKAGSTYEDFSRYAAKARPGSASDAQKKEFIGILSEKCPRGDMASLEKAAGTLLLYSAPAAHK